MSSSPKTSTSKFTDKDAEKSKEQQKANVPLEEDDEFEDFPVEDWEETEADAPGKGGNLWEESWDDDDTSDDFSAQLREELKKAQTKKPESMSH
ncbi:26S proteasome complex subunit [Rhizina undulata]